MSVGGQTEGAPRVFGLQIRSFRPEEHMVDELDVASLVARIESEYREMPGLQLTAPQMRRMWCLDAITCEVVIGTLLSHRIVVKTSRDAYARADHNETATAA